MRFYVCNIIVSGRRIHIHQYFQSSLGKEGGSKMPMKITKDMSSHLIKYVRTVDIHFNREYGIIVG